MKDWLVKPTSRRWVAVVFVAVLIYGAGVFYWVHTATDNLAAR